jgi:hypothetical protein
MEKEANALYKKYKNQLTKKLGIHPLTNQEIDEISKTLFGAKYKGSFAQNEKFEKKPGYYIINTDLKSGPGIHWISLIISSKNAYIYDSFARASKKIVPHLVKHLYPLKIIESKKDKEQKNSEIICGHLAVSWLLVARDLGIKYAIKI